MASNSSISVRLARPEDVPEIIEMVEALAVFEKIYGEPKLTVKGNTLER